MEVRLVAAGAARDLSRQRIAEGAGAMLLRDFFSAWFGGVARESQRQHGWTQM